MAVSAVRTVTLQLSCPIAKFNVLIVKLRTYCPSARFTISRVLSGGVGRLMI